MLHRHNEIFLSLVVLLDLLLVGASWVVAYELRFYSGLPIYHDVPPREAYIIPLAAIVPLWFLLYRAHGLYSPRRSASIYDEAMLLLRANVLGVLLLVAITFFVRSYFYSRGVIAIFAVVSAVSVVGVRGLLRLGLRGVRRRGYNLRHIVIVGSGRLASEVIGRIQASPEAGLRIIGIFSESLGNDDPGRREVEYLGGYSQVKSFLREHRVDQVMLAMERDEGGALEKVVRDLDDEVTSVKFVPDLMHIMTLRSSVEELDGLPVINLRETPLLGWAAVRKRFFDLGLACVFFVLTLPIQIGIGFVIWATSGRPIFYSQERLGFDGRVFSMIKFRTMEVDAETRTGPVWSRADDERRTPLGARLRRFSLDELPQLWNVIRGDMSLVGPRPERPVFIDVFRREIPGYMLRHQIKAGMTGWAQVHGLRGDTSLLDRVEHDVFYIQNWSLALDVRILLLTVRHLLVDRSGV